MQRRCGSGVGLCDPCGWPVWLASRCAAAVGLSREQPSLRLVCELLVCHAVLGPLLSSSSPKKPHAPQQPHHQQQGQSSLTSPTTNTSACASSVCAAVACCRASPSCVCVAARWAAAVSAVLVPQRAAGWSPTARVGKDSAVGVDSVSGTSCWAAAEQAHPPHHHCRPVCTTARASNGRRILIMHTGKPGPQPVWATGSLWAAVGSQACARLHSALSTHTTPLPHLRTTPTACRCTHARRSRSRQRARPAQVQKCV